MATNPMQRRSRNSFLLGILITTLILGAIIAGLVFLMINMKNKQNELEAVTVSYLTKDISSGDEITASDITTIKVSRTIAPSNAVGAANLGEKNIAKIDLKKGTILSGEMLYIDATSTGNDLRKQEYNTIVLPMDLKTGDYVDIRLILPSGQDFIVVSKKKVEIPMIAGVDSSDTICMELAEEETLTMSNAIVETYMINGSKLYATKYTDAGNQEAAKTTYPVNGEVAKLIEEDPNIVTTALNALRSRYNREIRENYINSTLSAQDDAVENEKTKMQQSITNSQTTRQQYLQSLSGGTTK